ncbi:MAG: hypothetical protein ACKVHQ_11540 [Gammaproteobacteria bacterium]|jgi:arginine exporter protein ArgO
MNEGQIKTKIMIIQVVDWTLLIAVFTVGGFSVFYAEDPKVTGALALFGLFLLNMLGKYSTKKLATYRVDLNKIKRMNAK